MKRHSASEIVARLRQADALIANGFRVSDAVRAAGVAAITYYRWRRKYDGLTDNQAERLAELQAEAAKLRKFVADLKLDNRILTEVLKTFGLSPAQRRVCVDHVTFELDVSERRACQVLGQNRSTQRKQPKRGVPSPGGRLADSDLVVPAKRRRLSVV